MSSSVDDDDFDHLSPRRGRNNRPRQAALPVFVTTVMIVELVFGLFHAILCIGIFAGSDKPRAEPRSPPMQYVPLAHAIVEPLLTVTTILAAIGVLMRTGWGVKCGWAASGLTLVSISLVVWATVVNLVTPLDSLSPGDVEMQQEFPGMLHAARMILNVISFVVIGFRVVWLTLYSRALQQYSNWLERTNINANATQPV